MEQEEFIILVRNGHSCAGLSHVFCPISVSVIGRAGLALGTVGQERAGWLTKPSLDTRVICRARVVLHPRGFCGWDAWDSFFLGRAVDIGGSIEDKDHLWSMEATSGADGAEWGGQIMARP